MKIAHLDHFARINQILCDPTLKLSVAEKHVLEYLQSNFLRNAEKNAFTWAPDGRTYFHHQEVVQYLPLDIMSDKVVKLLADVGITFEKATIKGVFPVVTS